MLGKSEPVVLVKQEISGFQPLHPNVSLMSLSKLINSNATNSDSFIGALICGSRNIFVTVNVRKELDDENIPCIDGEELPVLYVTELFLQHYDFREKEVYSFKKVNAYPVKQVVFGAKTESSFLWAKQKTWNESLLKTVSTKTSLCRMNDVFLLAPDEFDSKDFSPFGLCTVFVEPIEQGLITVNTKVVVADMSNEDYIDDFFPLDDSINEYEAKLESSLQDVSRTSEPNRAVRELPDETRSSAYFQIIVLLSLEPAFRRALENTDIFLDPFNTIFISADLAKKLGYCAGDWVKAQCYRGFDGENNEKCGKLRFVTICPFDPDKRENFSLQQNIVYMTPHLWFNLNSQPSTHHIYSLSIEPWEAENTDPPYANEVFVALVQSPSYSGSISSEELLKKYFKDTRYICSGDIICIDGKGIVEFDERDRLCRGRVNLRWPVVYFRVSVIDGPANETGGHLIDSRNTRLYQAGTAQSYIPATVESFYSSCLESSYFSDSSPPGLEYYVDLLEEIILPILNILNNKFQVSSRILLTGKAGCGKSVIVKAVCKRLNLHFYQVNCHEMSGETSSSIEAKLKAIVDRAYMFAPCITLLKNIDVIGQEVELKGENSRVLSSLTELLRSTSVAGKDWPCVIVATTSESKLLNEDLSSAFLQTINIEPPPESERCAIIECLFNASLLGFDVDFDYIAKRSAGFGLSDLCALVVEAKKISHCRVRRLLSDATNMKLEEDLSLAGVPIIQEDILCALDKLQSELAKMTNAPKIPNVVWEDVGGLFPVKNEVIDTIMLPMDRPEILATGLRRAGILLYGPPGTGKTLIAKAVATECSMSFISVKGPELLNMYVGQSEENVRAVFSQARSASPCIIFFDELDSLAPNRGKSGDSTGVMDRVVAQLLAELDGLNKSNEVFAIGATNRPDLIDPALLRPGRFDRLVYVGIPDSKESKLSVLRALTRKMPIHSDVDFEQILEECPPNLTGADFYSLCNDAMMLSAEKNIRLIESKGLKMEETECVVHHQDFLDAVKCLSPSVSLEQHLYYQRLQQNI